MNLRPHHSSITWKKHARNQQRVFLRNHTAATPISSATRGIVQVLDRLSSDEDEIAKHLVMALLRTVHADACKPGPVANRAIARFEAISDHLLENCHLPIDRQTVAREFHMHPNHLSRLFRTQAGESFTDHLTQLRMERACNCLATRRWSVQDVASMCGFASANYFSKVFHKHHGVSPSEWKP
ncbi:MAG: helix-turn-helix transcriptional regulator [Planctomycetota bacterium]|nr:helix-turn-helix transcriptional regulator [Planctomycetota bacterium]